MRMSPRRFLFFFVFLLGNHDDAQILMTPSAPPLASTESVGWNSTASTPSSPFFRSFVSSWRQLCELRRSQKRTEQSWAPETREKPDGSMERDVTASRCASIECVH